MASLIINADDLGYSPAINRAIVALHRAGLVTSASLLTNLPFSQQGVEAALAWPALSIGVHLNLSRGRPLLPSETVPTLVDDRGAFWPSSVFYRHALTGQVNWREAAAELETQVAWAVVRGLVVDNLDSHVHFQLLPPARRIIERLAAQFSIVAWRTPEMRSTLLPSRLWNELLAAPAPEHNSLTAPHYLISLHQWGERLLQDESLAQLLTKPGVVTELVVHPGYADDPHLPLPDQLPAYRRQAELDLLLGPSFRPWLIRLGLQLVSFSDLANPVG